MCGLSHVHFNKEVDRTKPSNGNPDYIWTAQYVSTVYPPFMLFVPYFRGDKSNLQERQMFSSIAVAAR